MKRYISMFLIVAAAAVVLAVTSGGNSKAHKAAQVANAGRAASVPANPALDLRRTSLGKVLVDDKGRTLYLFEADKRDMSSCSSACLSIWPALSSTGKPQAHGGVLATKIGTIAGAAGKQQVTYNGHPLYYYAGDQRPGDINGQGLNQFGAAWYVLGANGDKIDNG
jgi:predicted lipoprotein with Yx(FWY)xxD motif